MKRVWLTTAAALAAVLFLSACAAVKRLPSATDHADTSVFVSGQRSSELDVAQLREKLSELKDIDLTTEEARGNLRNILENIEKGMAPKEEVPDSFRGVGGFFTRLLVDTALSPPSAVVTRKLSGKIRRYLFNRHTKAGYLEVDTTVATFLNGAPAGKDDFRWSIAVLPGQFGVHQRVDSNPTDPFPGTVPLPEAALDMTNPKGIWKRGLDHKLYAHGTGIVVLGVTRNGVLLPATDPVYQSDNESCIDLLVKGFPPEQTLPEQSAYCLGRCEHPMVVNTGM